MPGLTIPILKRLIFADYSEITSITRIIAAKLRKSQTLKITTNKAQISQW